MVIRDGETLVPERRTVLRHGDELLVVTPRRLRERTEQRLRQVSEGGRLAQWLGDEPAADRRAGRAGRPAQDVAGGLQIVACRARDDRLRRLRQRP